MSSPMWPWETGLRKGGHTVRILTSLDFQALVTAYDLDFFDVGGNMQAVAQSMQSLLEKGNFLKILSSMGKTARSLASQAAIGGLAACQDSDLIIGGLGGLFAGLALSEKLGIPFMQAYYFPFTPTREFPNAIVPSPPGGLPKWTNRLTHTLAQQMMWQNYRTADNRARHQVLHMAPAPFWGPFPLCSRKNRPSCMATARRLFHSQMIGATSSMLQATGFWSNRQAGNRPRTSLISFRLVRHLST